MDAYQNFLDPDWDGGPLEPVPLQPGGIREPGEGFEIGDPPPRPQKIKIKLANGKVRQIQCMTAVSYWSPDGTPMSAQRFLEKLFGQLPEFYSSEAELRQIWSKPETRRELLRRLDESGFGAEALGTLQEMIAASDSDILNVLEFVSYQIDPITRASRVASAQLRIYEGLDGPQREFIEFVLARYVDTGVEVLDLDILPELLELRFGTVADASRRLGGVQVVRQAFIDFQKYLYLQIAS